MNDSDSGRESPVVNYRPKASYHHPKLIDNDRNTKLHYAAAQSDLQAVKEYLQKESHVVDPQNYFEWTPLMMACRKGHLEIVKCLVTTYRANTTLRNRFGMNVFQIAIASGNLELIKFLLEHLLSGGTPKRFLERDLPVASLAILFRHQKVLEFLISQKFDINGSSLETGVTPLMFAHAMENNAATTTLLQNKVETKTKNCLGHTAVDIATIRQHMKLVPINDNSVLARKLSAQDSLQTELQNQQLRNVLQLKPEASVSTSPNVFTSQPQLPYIILSPYPHSPQIGFLTVPSHMPPLSRKSSNVSPFPAPPPSLTTPLSSIYGQIGQQQVFFPPNFSPSQMLLNVTPQEYNIIAAQSNASEFLNARFNSSAEMFFSPTVMNFLSPCM